MFRIASLCGRCYVDASNVLKTDFCFWSFWIKSVICFWSFWSFWISTNTINIDIFHYLYTSHTTRRTGKRQPGPGQFFCNPVILVRRSGLKGSREGSRPHVRLPSRLTDCPTAWRSASYFRSCTMSSPQFPHIINNLHLDSPSASKHVSCPCLVPCLVPSSPCLVPCSSRAVEKFMEAMLMR